MRFLFHSVRASALIGVCFWLGCPARRAQVRHGASSPGDVVVNLTVEQAGPRVAAAIQRGDYAAAVALTERTALPEPEKDHAVGLLTLDALVDEAAATHPPGQLEHGLRRIEAAALAGYSDAATSLRTLFKNGLSSQGKNVHLAPSSVLSTCWEQVEAGATQAAACVRRRRAPN